MRGSRPSTLRVDEALSGLRINKNITSAMLPHITFEPTLGITARRIDKLGMDIRSFREPLKRSIQQVVAPSIRKNFDVGGRPEAWLPDSDATVEIQKKIKNVGPHPPMVLTGKLRRTISSLQVWRVTEESALLVNIPQDIRYGAIHQKGYEGTGRVAKGKRTDYGRKALAKARRGQAGGKQDAETPPIPPRPFVMLQPQDEEAIQAVFATWLGERIDRAWPSG
jgi:phage gpG-like protein